MNVLTLALKALQYQQQIEQTIEVAEDIVKGRVGTEPEITQVKYKQNGRTYAVTVIAQEIFDSKDPSVAARAEAFDEGAALNEFNASQ